MFHRFLPVLSQVPLKRGENARNSLPIRDTNFHFTLPFIETSLKIKQTDSSHKIIFQWSFFRARFFGYGYLDILCIWEEYSLIGNNTNAPIYWCGVSKCWILSFSLFLITLDMCGVWTHGGHIASTEICRWPLSAFHLKWSFSGIQCLCVIISNARCCRYRPKTLFRDIK